MTTELLITSIAINKQIYTGDQKQYRIGCW